MPEKMDDEKKLEQEIESELYNNNDVPAVMKVEEVGQPVNTSISGNVSNELIEAKMNDTSVETITPDASIETNNNSNQIGMPTMPLEPVYSSDARNMSVQQNPILDMNIPVQVDKKEELPTVESASIQPVPFATVSSEINSESNDEISAISQEKPYVAEVVPEVTNLSQGEFFKAQDAIQNDENVGIQEQPNLNMQSDVIDNSVAVSNQKVVIPTNESAVEMSEINQEVVPSSDVSNNINNHLEGNVSDDVQEYVSTESTMAADQPNVAPTVIPVEYTTSQPVESVTNDVVDVSIKDIPIADTIVETGEIQTPVTPVISEPPTSEISVKTESSTQTLEKEISRPVVAPTGTESVIPSPNMAAPSEVLNSSPMDNENQIPETFSMAAYYKPVVDFTRNNLSEKIESNDTTISQPEPPSTVQEVINANNQTLQPSEVKKGSKKVIFILLILLILVVASIVTYFLVLNNGNKDESKKDNSNVEEGETENSDDESKPATRPDWDATKSIITKVDYNSELTCVLENSSEDVTSKITYTYLYKDNVYVQVIIEDEAIFNEDTIKYYDYYVGANKEQLDEQLALYDNIIGEVRQKKSSVSLAYSFDLTASSDNPKNYLENKDVPMETMKISMEGMGFTCK